MGSGKVYVRKAPKSKSKMRGQSKADRAYKIARKLEKAVEHKHLDTLTSATAPTMATGVSFFQLSGVTQGDAEANRDGNKIMIESLYIKFLVAQAATATNQRVRLVIIRTGRNTVIPDTDDIFADIDNIRSFGLLQPPVPHRVLLDKTFNLDTLKNDMVTYQKYLKINKECVFDGNGGGDVQNGHLWALVVTEEGTNKASHQLDTRIRFTDN